uniref:Uncharacterized protein n=2 Tax=Micrurus lemniscatus lemniscatus TaxID=129467 RepID=A0A2D4J9P3_MICLE
MLSVCAGTENKEVQKRRNLHLTMAAVLTFLNTHMIFFLNKKYTQGHCVFFLLCTFSSHLNSIFKVQCSPLFLLNYKHLLLSQHNFFLLLSVSKEHFPLLEATAVLLMCEVIQPATLFSHPQPHDFF